MTRGLNSSRSSRASTERPFAEFAHPIPNGKPFGDGSINEGNQKGIATEVRIREREGACEPKLLALISSARSCASTDRRLAEIANPIFAAQKDGSIDEGGNKKA